MMSKAFLAVALNSTGLTLGAGVAVGVGLGIGVEVGVGSTGLKTGFGDGFGAAVIAIPLFQTSFVPDLTHVNFLPDEIDVVPALVHLAPALGVDAWTGAARVKSKKTENIKVIFFCTVMASSLYLRRIRNSVPCLASPNVHLCHLSRCRTQSLLAALCCKLSP